MREITECLKEEHRALEESLDALEAAIASGSGLAECVSRAAARAREHYRREAAFLDRLGQYEPELAAKLRAQHEEACEMAEHFEQAREAEQIGDMCALARRFHAIAQHNLIEEERDGFPLAVRCFTNREQRELIDTLAEAGLGTKTPSRRAGDSR